MDRQNAQKHTIPETARTDMINLDERANLETVRRLNEAIDFTSNASRWLADHIVRHLGPLYGCPDSGSFETLLLAKLDCDCEEIETLLEASYGLFDLKTEMQVIKGAIVAIGAHDHKRRTSRIWLELPEEYAKGVISVLNGSMSALYSRFGCTNPAEFKQTMLQLIKKAQQKLQDTLNKEDAHV